MAGKLDTELQKQIIALCQHGAKLADMREFDFALSKYYEALTLVPDPKSDYKATTWIYSSIGEVHWKKRNYNEAGRAFLQAYRSAGGEQSADVNFRLGQCLVECGAADMAHTYLLQAYMLDGDALFAGENEKYFDVIRDEVEGPAEQETVDVAEYADSYGESYDESYDEYYEDEDEMGDYEVLSQLVGDSGDPYAEPVVVMVDEDTEGEDEDHYARRSRYTGSGHDRQYDRYREQPRGKSRSVSAPAAQQDYDESEDGFDDDFDDEEEQGGGSVLDNVLDTVANAFRRFIDNFK